MLLREWRLFAMLKAKKRSRTKKICPFILNKKVVKLLCLSTIFHRRTYHRFMSMMFMGKTPPTRHSIRVFWIQQMMIVSRHFHNKQLCDCFISFIDFIRYCFFFFFPRSHWFNVQTQEMHFILLDVLDSNPEGSIIRRITFSWRKNGNYQYNLPIYYIHSSYCICHALFLVFEEDVVYDECTYHALNQNIKRSECIRSCLRSESSLRGRNQ